MNKTIILLLAALLLAAPALGMQYYYIPAGPESPRVIYAGTQAIAAAQTSVSVTFDTAFDDSDYSLSVSLQNIVGVNASIIATMITAKTAAGFTVAFSSATTDTNYILNWRAAE